MPISPPNLDDRTFADLVQEAQRIVRERSPDWTDLTPGDPGLVLIELFAHLTDVMLYRLNRIPDKAYVEFLRLLGVRLTPPGSATVILEFRTERPSPEPIEIRPGTRVTQAVSLPGMEPPVFVTAESATIEAGATTVQVDAYDCELVDAELAGIGSGRPGQFVVAKRPPVVATGDPGDLLVGVRANPDELDDQTVTIEYEGGIFRIWDEVESFASTSRQDRAFVVDRMEGLVTFAPAARLTSARTGELAEVAETLAAVPELGREIRLWYRRGGGVKGNVAAGTLTVLKDTVPGVSVINPEAAAGGRAAETLDNALVRGPQELHSLSRLVTARDFELAATSLGAVSRARAVALASLWTFAAPGQVEVALVPDVPAEAAPDGRVTAEVLRGRQTADALQDAQSLLDARRPLGTRVRATWCRYKQVTVRARLHVRREEDIERVRESVIRALHGTINPLPNQVSPAGWAFGQPLRISDVYYVAQRQPGVRYVDSVRLELDEAPDRDVDSVAADRSQPHLWYAASGAALFTSLNDGAGWELASLFGEERVKAIRPNPDAPGLVAVSTSLGGAGARVHVSEDCGGEWRRVAEVADSPVRDLAWTNRDGQPLILIATDHGLYELAMQRGSTPVPVLLDPDAPSRGVYALAVGVVRGGTYVAAAMQHQFGVLLSAVAGRSGTFRPIGLAGQDVRALAVQQDGARGFLWAGVMVQSATDVGQGCRSWELGEHDPPEGWSAHDAGWSAGSCTGIAFAGSAIVAATHHGGMLRLEGREAERWITPDVNCGLPLRDAGRFDRLSSVAAAPDGFLAMAGGPRGVSLTRDQGVTFSVDRRVLTVEDVTVPPTWLLCSGDHQIEVVRY